MIKRKIASLFVIILAFLLQTTVFKGLELAGVVPQLMLVATVSYAYLRGRTSGLLIGFLCGLMLDMYGGTVIGLYAFIFMTIGFAVGFCQKFYFTNNLVLPAILIVSGDFVYGIYYYITEFLMRGKLYIGFYMLHVVLPEVIYTGIVGILAYRLIVALENLLNKKRKEEESAGNFT